MKKAQEYADFVMKFENDAEIVSALSKVMVEIFIEIGELMESRNIKKRTALKSIIKQQDQKWKSVCNKVGHEEFRGSFMDTLRSEHKELLYEAGMI